MAGPARELEGLTDVDRRHFDFTQTLLRISEALTKEETANVKLFCMHLIPKGKAEKLKRAVDVFVVLIEKSKIDQENLDFVEEILERIGRQDLIRDVLRPFQPPDREIPENPELQPGTSASDSNTDGSTTSNAYVVVHGQVRMIQETLDRLRGNLASLCGTRRSRVQFRGYKKHKSILVHFSIPREDTAMLRHMADHCDPRLVYMGVKSLQIDAERPIEVTQGELFSDGKRQHAVDDIRVGCSTPRKQQRAPKTWSRLSALNLFSDALPLHLQVAESLEYQGFSYSLVQALVQKDQLREHSMRQVIQNFKQTVVDSNTFMTMRSKIIITENRLKEALETITVLEEKLQQAREYAEKAAQQVTSPLTEYTGEKPPGGWSAHAEKEHIGTETHLADDERAAGRPGDEGVRPPEESTLEIAGKTSAVPGSDSAIHQKDELSDKQTVTRERPTLPGVEAAALGPTGDRDSGVITYGGEGSEPSQFQYPRGVVVSPSNEIFVADTNNSRVQVHNTEGVYLRHFPTVVPGTGDKEMVPYDVCMDGKGTLWVVGVGESAHHVVQYSKDGTAMTQFDLPSIANYRGIAVDMRNNHILVTDAVRGEVHVFRPDGSLVRRFGHPESEMRYPRYITVDGEGNILVSDGVTHSVYMYDESGKFLRKFGGHGSDEGQLLHSRGICTDSSGHIIVADWGNNRVQIFTRHGEFVRHIPTGSEIAGVAVGPEGQLVLTCFDKHKVTIFPNY